jgi:hypothetical protein
MTVHNSKSASSENSWLSFTDLILALKMSFNLDHLQKLLLVGKFSFTENQELEFTKHVLVSKLDTDGFQIKIDNEIRYLNFLERTADVLAENLIGGVVWFYEIDDVFEPSLFLQNLFMRNKEIKSFTIIMKTSNYSLEDVEKIQNITELLSLYIGQLRISGQFSVKVCMDFNFNQFNIYSNSKSKFTHSSEKENYFISHWNSSDLEYSTELDVSLSDTLENLHYEQKESEVNNLELLRILKSRENEILDLKNQLRSIAKLVEVREDNTVGMKFIQTEESKAKELLLDPPRLFRIIFKYLPNEIQFKVRRFRRRTLER